MERDFMGLNSKDSVVVVKEEAVEGCKESVFMKSSAVHRPPSDCFEGSKSRQAGEIQTSIRQGGTHFSMAAYPMQQSVNSVQVHNDTKQAVPVTMSNPYFRAQFGGAPIKQHGVSIASHAVIPHVGSFLVGTTEPWHSSKVSCAPAQLTIFYGGMVNVYDDISPEKAQAIMFLAGNGASASTPQPRVNAQVPIPRTLAGDAVYMSQPINTQPCSALSSPLSVSSHPVGQSTGGPTNKDETGKTTGGLVASTSKVEAPRVINSIEQVMQSAVPQARKASLARFLEKRKERVMASAPYSVSKGSTECIGSPGPRSSGNAIAAGEQ